MPTATEAQIGIEPCSGDPFADEGSAWITQEKYESTTPEHWQALPVSYFQRRGSNKLVLGAADDLSPDSVFRSLLQPQHGSETSPNTTPSQLIPDIDIHLRSDGLFLWSRAPARGVVVPVGAIATYAPDKQQLPLPSSASSFPPAYSSPVPVLRLDLIPDSDDGGGGGMEDDSFAPSLLLIVAFAPGTDPNPESTPDITSPPTATTTTTAASSDSICQTLASESQLPAASLLSSLDGAVRAFLSSLARCQEQLPDEQGSEDGDGGAVGRRLRLPAIHAGSVGMDVDGDGGADEVRIPALAGFDGWVTAENVHEVMRERGIVLNGDGDEMTDGDVAGDASGRLSGLGLGPGAGSRRQRGEGGGVDGAEDEDGERVTIWQRTEG